MCCLSYEEDSGARIYFEDQDELVGCDEEEDMVEDEDVQFNEQQEHQEQE